MPCKTIFFEGKPVGFACSRGHQRQDCRICGMPSTKLCDYPLKNGKTCDMPLCARHAHAVGPDMDYCPAHFEMKGKALNDNGNPQEH